ncbi:MAG: hypothetical protein EBY60_03775 [Actinobacteria bacterium]|nr:hypothetical protein [Actinomycetota bacterium]
MLGAQSGIGGGGRYDGLMESLGGATWTTVRSKAASEHTTFEPPPRTRAGRPRSSHSTIASMHAASVRATIHVPTTPPTRRDVCSAKLPGPRSTSDVTSLSLGGAAGLSSNCRPVITSPAYRGASR